MFIAMNRFKVIKGTQSLRGFVGDAWVASRRGLPDISLAARARTRGPCALFISYNLRAVGI